MEVLQVFPCERCGKTFDYIYALKRHGKNCGAKKPRKCKKCLKWFANQSATSRHEEQCFMDSTPLACKFCAKTYEHLYTLQRHYRNKHRIKMSGQNKKPLSYDSEFESECQVYNESLNEVIRSTDNEEQQLNEENITPSVYTIEIDDLSDMSNDIDPNIQTLVYKIRETNSNTAEIELLPECMTPSDVLTESINYEHTNSLDNIVYEETTPTVYYGIE